MVSAKTKMRTIARYAVHRRPRRHRARRSERARECEVRKMLGLVLVLRLTLRLGLGAAIDCSLVDGRESSYMATCVDGCSSGSVEQSRIIRVGGSGLVNSTGSHS